MRSPSLQGWEIKQGAGSAVSNGFHLGYKIERGINLSHSLTRIWIHTILGTKNCAPTISTHFEDRLHNHIKSHIEDDFDCPVRAINGSTDHVHVLLLLSPNYAIKDILQNMKGESSHWVNQENLTSTKFAWQTGYAAFSVSESSVAEVQWYIENQKQHHASRTLEEECGELFLRYGLAAGCETVETVIGGRDNLETNN